MGGRWERGFSFVELLISVAMIFCLAASLTGAFVYGTQFPRAIRARTELLNRAQAEMERIRGISFVNLAGYPVSSQDIVGEVRVETLTPRRKRVAVLLRHARYGNDTLALVTYVHRRGLTQ